MIPRPLRPTLGGTNNGLRPLRYDYWRTGYGAPLNEPLNLSVVQAGVYHTKANYQLDENYRFVGSIQCFLQFGGRGTLVRDGGEIQTMPGHVVILQKDKPFIYRSQAGMKYHWVALDGAWPHDILSNGQVLDLTEDDEIEAQFVELRETLITQLPGFHLQAISGMFAILARLSARLQQSREPNSVYPDVVQHALAYLREHFAEPFDGEITARAAGVSPSYLRTLFDKWVGESPLQVHTRHRIEQAKRLLTQRHLSISEVAYHIGFRDPRYFSRVFKKQTGKTPLEFSQQSR